MEAITIAILGEPIEIGFSSGQICKYHNVKSGKTKWNLSLSANPVFFEELQREMILKGNTALGSFSQSLLNAENQLKAEIEASADETAKKRDHETISVLQKLRLSVLAGADIFGRSPIK